MKYAIVKIIDEETPLLSDFFDDYVSASKLTKATETIAHVILPALISFKKFVGNPKIGEITQSQVSRWTQTLTGYTHNTIHLRISTLKAVFNWGVKMKVISENPVTGVDSPAVEFTGRLLSDDDIGKIMLQAQPSLCRAIVFALHTGMRVGEVARSDHSWVVDGHIVIPFKQTKSRKERRILLHPAAKDCIGTGRGNIFKYKKHELTAGLSRAARDAGLGRVRFHDLRHTWATRFMEKTGDMASLMDQAGWANERSAKPYQHITRARKEAILKINYEINYPGIAGGLT